MCITTVNIRGAYVDFRTLLCDMLSNPIYLISYGGVVVIVVVSFLTIQPMARKYLGIKGQIFTIDSALRYCKQPYLSNSTPEVKTEGNLGLEGYCLMHRAPFQDL